jgi:hypothetical protein
VTYTLGSSWLAVSRSLVQALGAHLILGLNLAADSPEVAASEARTLIDGIGKGAVQALELGNEPELYGGFAWYRTPDGRSVTARSRSYDFDAFLRDFTNIAGALPEAPLAGPNIGGPAWMPYLDRFLRAQPRVSLVTMHRYPLQLCYSTPGSGRYPTVRHLLSAAASSGLAKGFQRDVRVAHSHGLALRIDELNTVSCGAAPAISQTFASALWAIDALFEMARVGVDGVNIHTFPGAGYELFKFSPAAGGWSASVAPEYYGLMMFERAAPPGSQLLRVSGAGNGQVKVWATLAPDGRIRIVVINKGSRGRVVAVRVPGAIGPASLVHLTAPSVQSVTGVTLAGQSFGSSTDTGTLEGTPQTTLVPPAHGRYTIRLPRAGTALLTLGLARSS